MSRKSIHHIVYILCLMIIAGAIPLSNFAMSVGGIFLTINWFVEGNLKTKWKRIKNNKLSLLLSGFFLFCLLTLLMSKHLSIGIQNIINKLPLFYAPLIFVSSDPLSGKHQRWVLNTFIIATIFGSLASYAYYFTHEIRNIREISIFISHIRFSLCIVLSIFLCIFFAIKIKVYSKQARFSYLLGSIWLVIYLFFAQTLSGIVIFFLSLFFILFYLLLRKAEQKKWILLGSALIILLPSAYLANVIFQYYHTDIVSIEQLDKKTAEGNLYYHNINSIVENGSPVEIYISEPELHDEWRKRSSIPFNEVNTTLIRYLNSKGLRKDRIGIQTLTEKDIWNIENGIANIYYSKGFGVKRSLYPILFSFSLYDKYHIIEYSSLLQRMELWNAGIQVIKNNFWFGVGAGDHKIALDEQLFLQDSPLVYKQNMGCHNQFLTYWIMGGIFLFVYFIVTLYAPFILSKKSRNWLYITLFIIIFASLFVEDTLETQAGVTLYTFFNSFFLFIFNAKNIALDPSLKVKEFNNKYL